MSDEENVEAMITDDNQSASGQPSNRRDPAPIRLNITKRRQLLDIKSDIPEPSSSRVNLIHNKLNSTEDTQKVTSKYKMDISLSSPEECTDNRTYKQPSKLRSYRRYNNDHIMDMVDDDDSDDNTKVMNKSQDSDDNNKVDDGMFRVAGFIDDSGDELEIDVDVLRASCMTSRPKIPFVDLYIKPSRQQDTTMLLLESYNKWLKGYKARNTVEQQQPVVEHASPLPKQTFADRMKGNNAATPSKEEQKELLVQLTDIINSPRLGENKGVCEKYLNNSTAGISSPVTEKEETTVKEETTIFNSAQDFPDLYSRTTSAAKELRQQQQQQPAASSYSSNKSQTNQTAAAAAASSSTIIVDITTDEKWNPNTGSWSNNNRKARQKQANNDLNKPNNDQQKADVKVQCPICQRGFPVAKVESHAAQCFQFPMETRSNNQDSSSTVTSSRDTGTPAALNNSVDLTESDEEWEKVRGKVNKRRGSSDEDDLNGTNNVKRACRRKL